MGIELTLLIPVIVLFIISFCGLLKKIRKSYEAERIIDDRNVGTLSNISIPEIYVNQSFSRESENSTSESVFPGAPPPYSEYCIDPPPKYEDIFKQQQITRSNQNIT